MGGMDAGRRLVLAGVSLVVLGGCSRTMKAPPPEPDARLIQTGLGVQDPVGLTGSVASIRMTRTDRLQFHDMQQFLQGRVAGLQVISQGAGQYTLRLRGTTSLNMSNEPLVVIDGVPVPPEGVSSALSIVTPDMVKRVDVLKDAGETAIWGIRGANGVIVITTLRGSDPGR